MSEISTPDVRFDGIGVTGGNAGEAAHALAERLNHWSSDHPNRRIVQLSIQSAATAAKLELTAIIAFLEDPDPDGGVVAEAAVSVAEEIVADAQGEREV